MNTGSSGSLPSGGAPALSDTDERTLEACTAVLGALRWIRGYTAGRATEVDSAIYSRADSAIEYAVSRLFPEPTSASEHQSDWGQNPGKSPSPSPTLAGGMSTHQRVDDGSRVDIESVRLLSDTLARIEQTLTIPAAEYVPAIGDVFGIIDKARAVLAAPSGKVENAGAQQTGTAK